MSKIDKEKLIEMKLEGKTNNECATTFGCTVDAVRSAIRRLRASGEWPEQAEDYTAEKQLQTADAPAEQPVDITTAVCVSDARPTKTVAEWLAEEEAAEARKRTEAESDAAEDPTKSAYPAPPIDRKTFWRMRRDELRGAICEFAYCGLRIDPAWVDEYNDLVEEVAQ